MMTVSRREPPPKDLMDTHQQLTRRLRAKQLFDKTVEYAFDAPPMECDDGDLEIHCTPRLVHFLVFVWIRADVPIHEDA